MGPSRDQLVPFPRLVWECPCLKLLASRVVRAVSVAEWVWEEAGSGLHLSLVCVVVGLGSLPAECDARPESLSSGPCT